MNNNRGMTVAVAATLGIALAVRLGFAAWWQVVYLPHGQTFAFPDSESYWELGQQIAENAPYEFRNPHRRVFRAPGYPLLLAGLFRVLGTDISPLWGRILGAVVGTCTVGAVLCLARQLFSNRAALVASLIVALYPGAIVTSGLVLAEAPFSLWMLVHLILWHRADSAAIGDGSRSPAVLFFGLGAGVAAGLATLTRPSWLLFIPLAVLLLLPLRRDGRRQLLSVGGLMVLGLLLTMMPWWIRNWRVTGRFVPTTLQVGASLYDGLNPEADGSSDMQFVKRFEAQLHEADAQHVVPDAPPLEYRLDSSMRTAALKWAMGHPGRVAKLAVVKFVRLWNVWPNEPSFRRLPMRLIVLASYTPVMLLALAGVWTYRRQRFTVVLLMLPAIYTTLLHVVFVGSLRYRQPAMLTLAVLAAAALVGPEITKSDHETGRTDRR